MISDKESSYPHDIGFLDLEDVDWGLGKAEVLLDRISHFAIDHARRAIQWYLGKKPAKRRGARITRGAILLVILSGLIPLISQLREADGHPWMNPLWTSVMLVLAGGCVGFDRFFGFSTAYVRYLTTELRLLHLVHEFQIDWQIRCSGWVGEAPKIAQIQDALLACKRFVLSVDQAVQAETEAWAQEFTAVLVEIDKTATAQSEAARSGVVNVIVTNGEQCTEGWLLSIDGGAGQQQSGRSAAIRSIFPGAHGIKVTGVIDGALKECERNVIVTVGAIIETELTLS